MMRGKEEMRAGKKMCTEDMKTEDCQVEHRIAAEVGGMRKRA